MPEEVRADPEAAARPLGQALALATPEELLSAYVNGHEVAFSILVERLGGRLFGFLVRYLGDHHLAEDVYQTVLIKLARHAPSFDRRAKLTTWLYQIARNACIDALRRKPRVRTVPLEVDPEEEGPEARGLPAAGSTPAEDAARRELGRRILQAVDGLPEEQREVFLLKEEGDLTFEEIGDLLGCGKETAKSRMRYALRRLQNALGAEARLFGVE